MSDWKNIIVDGHHHPLSAHVFQITQAIYRERDPQYAPDSLHRWWNSQSVGYQLDDSGELDIIILNLREGRPGFQAMDTRFTVNFKTRKVTGKLDNNTRVPVPQEVQPLMDEIEACVRRTIAEKRAAEQRAAERRAAEERAAKERAIQHKRKAEDDHLAQVKAFHDRRSENGLSESVVDVGTGSMDFSVSKCGLCHRRLVNCRGCRRLCCLNSPREEPKNKCQPNDIEKAESTRGCHAWRMDELRTCDKHPYRAFRKACRQGAVGEVDKLLECPDCGIWQCSNDLYWCIGRELSQPSEAHEPAGSPEPAHSAAITGRQHPPKHACRDCVFGQIQWPQCDNSRCWSNESVTFKGLGYRMVCADCSPNDGHRCSGDHRWACDVCSLKPQGSMVLECPSCKEYFCRDRCLLCVCVVCRQVGWCQQCTDNWNRPQDNKDDSGNPGKGSPPHLTRPCDGCESAVCSPCATKNYLRSCENCDREVCDSCFEIDRCTSCNAILCASCSDEECRCGGVGEMVAANMETEEEVEWGFYSFLVVTLPAAILD